MKNSDMPAMPSQWKDFDSMGIEVTRESYHGLTKREYFAGLAMQSVLNKYDPWTEGDFDSSDYEVTAKNAVGLADALLKALEE